MDVSRRRAIATRGLLLPLTLFATIAAAQSGLVRSASIVATPLSLNNLDFDTAVLDTFCLYGGPGTDQGRFQDTDAGTADRQGWIGIDHTEVEAPFVDRAGDFSKVLDLLAEPDPCRSDPTPQMTFIDDGTPPANAPDLSTGGSVGVQWPYGPGGYVVNPSNGVSIGGLPLHNEVWSPPIAWDLPGTADDAANSAYLEFDLWDHLPLEHGIFWTWRARAHQNGSWSAWHPDPTDSAPLLANPGPHYSDEPRYRRLRVLLPYVEPESLQVALGVIDLADALGVVGSDATPAPCFDDVSVVKFVRPGPLMRAQELQLFHDAFPADGSRTGAVRLDIAASAMDSVLARTSKYTKDRGDSMTFGVDPSILGECTAKNSTPVVRLVAVMKIRCTPTHPGWPPPCHDALAVGDSYEMEILAPDLVRISVAANSAGTLGPWAQWKVDLPDDPEPPVFYPGSVLHSYVECMDCQGNQTTLPGTLEGLLDFSDATRWDPHYTTYALPTPEGRIAGDPPSILLWIDHDADARADPALDAGPFDEGSSVRLWSHAFGQLGLVRGLDYDVYVSRAPGCLADNGLGSTTGLGASLDQLLVYQLIVYSADRQRSGLMSDGTAAAPNTEGNDVGMLRAWFELPGPRYQIVFGDNYVEGMTAAGPLTADYGANVLGVELRGTSVRERIDAQSSPRVRPLIPAWSAEFAVMGACPRPRDFDLIGRSGTLPPDLPGLRVTHQYLARDGEPYSPAVPAGMVWDRMLDGARKVTVVFPFAFAAVVDPRESTSSAVSARSALLGETLTYLGLSHGPVPTSASPPLRGELIVHPIRPNPLNPAANITLEAPMRGALRVRIFDVRGRLVRTVFEGIVDAGLRSWVWQGEDRAGRNVGSGVYVCEVDGFETVRRQKLVLLR